MFQKILKQHFGIDAIESSAVGRYQSCKNDHQRFVLVPVNQKDDKELLELEQIANHFINAGDSSVGIFLPTKENQRILEIESSKYCVLYWDEKQQRSSTRIGRRLAKFHYRGRMISFPVQKISRIGQWKSLWEKRIDQMEMFWKERMQHEPDHEFDRMFFESFPYYMAMTENAIQYLVDTELDDEPRESDYGTICHIRFSSQTWGSQVMMKDPFDWVLDHCSRDLAEWTREQYFNQFQTYEHEVQRFYSEYQTVNRLSSFSWRLLYARILFPLHYVDCIEEYYSTPSEQKKHVLSDRLEKFLQRSNDHEQFLRSFFQMVNVPVRHQNIPRIDWL
ncbi:spore coat protein YutH [Niallia sp. XMNu-256]|uniref:spore coat putative kinase YutH n=1 Tax=Niallia sp. XMNu-256 TaxID=3082444 RepID=UPI0030D59255